MAVVLIYAVAVVLCVASGVAVRGLLAPRERWIAVETVPLGLAALIAVLYPVGLVLSASAAAPVVIALIVVGLAGAVARRARAEGVGRRGLARSAARALTPSTAPAIVIAGGVGLGLLLLVATIRQGFPTTIAITNNDGWGFAGMVDWLKDHPFPRDVSPDIAHPMTLVPWNYDSNNFAVGFERFAAVVASLLDRQGFEVVNPVAAVGLAAAAGGWATLAGAIRGRLAPWEYALLLVAGATPVVVLPFTENYVAQFFSICLWPFAVGSFAAFARRPSWPRLVVAALATGAVVGVYPSVTPWLVLPLLVIAAIAPPRPNWEGTRLARGAGPGLRARAVRAGVLVVSLALGVAVVAPIQVVRGIQNVLFLEGLPINAIAGFFPSEDYAAIFLGAEDAVSVFARTPQAWSTTVALVILAAAYLLALAPSARRRGEWRLPAIAVATLLTTGAVLVRYRLMEELPYQVYKGIISGGGVLAGLIVIGLLPRGGSTGRVVRAVALGVVAAIWMTVSAHLLQASADGAPGFRRADVEMGRELARLPTGSTVLVEGAAPDAQSFQLRMMGAYFGDAAPHRSVIGVGSTGSYLTPGGLPEWRPSRPWTHVLATASQPRAVARPGIWRNSVYSLAAAPALDLTPFGNGWYPPEGTGGAVFAWTSTAADVVVANRSSRSVPARLTMTVASYGRPRVLSLSAPGSTVRVPLAADTLTPVGIDLDLRPRSVVTVTIDARPGAITAAGGDGRRLMVRVEDLRVTPRRDGAAPG